MKTTSQALYILGIWNCPECDRPNPLELASCKYCQADKFIELSARPSHHRPTVGKPRFSVKREAGKLPKHLKLLYVEPQGQDRFSHEEALVIKNRLARRHQQIFIRRIPGKEDLFSIYYWPKTAEE
jgi:hypothetical protein